MARSILLLSLVACLTPEAFLRGEEAPKTARVDPYGDPLPSGALARYGSARLRMMGSVTACAFWPNDRTLATFSAFGWIQLWDRATGREIRHVHIGSSVVESAVFVPKSPFVAFCDEHGNLVLWDSQSGKRAWKKKGFAIREQMVVSPNGKLLATAQDGGAGLVEVSSGRRLRTLPAERTIDGLFAFSPDSAALAVVNEKLSGEDLDPIFSPDNVSRTRKEEKPFVQLWDVHSGKKIRDLKNLKLDQDITSLAFSPNGRYLALGGSGFLLVLETATGRTKKRIPFKDGVGQGELLFSADSKLLVAGAWGRLRFLDVETGKEQFHRVIDREFSPRLALSADGKVLALTHRFMDYRSLHLLDAASGKDLFPPRGHRLEPKVVVFSADGRTVLSGDRTTLHRWEAADGKSLQQMRLGFSVDAVFSGDHKLLADLSGWNESGCIKVWDLTAGKRIRKLDYQGEDNIRAVAFLPDGKSLISIHNRGRAKNGGDKLVGEDALHVWDLTTGKETRHFPAGVVNLFRQLLVTSDGRLAIAGCTGAGAREVQFKTLTGYLRACGPIHVWDLPHGRLLRTLKGHEGPLQCLALSRDDRLLVSGSTDGTIRVWELASGKTLFTMGHEILYPKVLALSPDGLLLATNVGPTDNCTIIHLWSTATGKLLGKLPTAGSAVTALAFSPDGRQLASTLELGTALVWDVSAFQQKAQATTRRSGTKKLDTLWKELARADAARAHQALWGLVAHGEEAVGLLKQRLSPRIDGEPKQLRQLPCFGRLIAEMRRRIAEILSRISRKGPTAEQLRELRSIEVLERVGSVEARALLTRLAKGAPEAPLTQEAKKALGRLTLPRTAKR